MNVSMDRLLDEHVSGWMVGLMDRWKDGQDGWMEAQTDGWMDTLMIEWMLEWMDGRMY